MPWALAVAMARSGFAAQVLMTEAYGALSVGEAAAWLQLRPIAQVLSRRSSWASPHRRRPGRHRRLGGRRGLGHPARPAGHRGAAAVSLE